MRRNRKKLICYSLIMSMAILLASNANTYVNAFSEKNATYKVHETEVLSENKLFSESMYYDVEKHIPPKSACDFIDSKGTDANEQHEMEQYVIVDAKTRQTRLIDLSDLLYNIPNFKSNSAALADNMALPRKNSVGLWSILGDDTRTPVIDASIMPYSAIARLDITLKNGSKTYGSGALIANKLFATAAHVVVRDGELPQSVTLEFGRNGSQVCYTTRDIIAYILRSDYKTNPTAEGDYAFLVLKSGMGSKTGFFGIETSISVGTTIYTAGYPQDKGGNNMYLSQGVIRNVEADRVAYDADTIGGQSGSPVYIKKNGRVYIVAIHTHGTYSPNEVGATNSGRRIDASLCTWLRNNGYLD